MDQAIADGWNPGFARAWSTQDEGQAVMMRLFSLLTAVLCAAAPAYAQKRAFTLEDLYRVRSIGDLQVSPDGTRAAYTVTTSDLPRAKRTTHIWLLEMAGGQSRQLTFSDSSTSPVFSPDGKSLAFVSTRDGDANLYLLPLEGGEARALTHISTGVSDPVWSPDGKRMAFRRRLPECADDACNKKIAETWRRNAQGAHGDALFYRHWTAWKDGTRTHIFLADVPALPEPSAISRPATSTRRPSSSAARCNTPSPPTAPNCASCRTTSRSPPVPPITICGCCRLQRRTHGRETSRPATWRTTAARTTRRMAGTSATGRRSNPATSPICFGSLLRSAGRHVGGAHRGVSRLGVRLRLEPRLEGHRLPGRGAGRDAHLPARRREQEDRQASGRQDD